MSETQVMQEQGQETRQLWKAPHSTIDSQAPLGLPSDQVFDESFVRYEVEYGVVMDQLSKIYKSWKSTIREYIANAESACMAVTKNKDRLDSAFYEPEIRIIYDPGQCMLQIEDNGIGLSKRMFLEVFRYFGRSRNAFDPTVSGMFGLGAKSFVMLVGDKGSMTLHTKSRETGECYKMYARKLGFDVLPYENRDYGTAFTFIHDAEMNRAEIVKTIREYAHYVRVPVYLTVIGNQSFTCEIKYDTYPYTSQYTVQPQGPELISMNSIESGIDRTEFDLLNDLKEGRYSRDHNHSTVRLSFSTEHYDFDGLFHFISDRLQDSRRSRIQMLLISMPTETVSLEGFHSGIVRIKSETGAGWLPRPTPDRERFEEKSRDLFLRQLHSDIVQRLPEVIGTMESFGDFFKLKENERTIWTHIHDSESWNKFLPERTRHVFDVLFTEIRGWKDRSRDRDSRISGYYGQNRPMQFVHQALRYAFSRGAFIYLAPENAPKSRTMREKARTAMDGGHLIIAGYTPPEDLRVAYGNVFHDLSEVRVEHEENLPDEVIVHGVRIKSTLFNEPCRHHERKSLDSLKSCKTKQAAAFGAQDNLLKYLDMLRLTSHTCPVMLFKASSAQIKWLKENTKILPIREYIEWAKKQVLMTSQGQMTVEEISRRNDAVLHSISRQAGMRLMRVLKNVLYVPLSDEDYFMLTAARCEDKTTASKPRIYQNILTPLNLPEPHHLRWVPDEMSERQALWAYAMFAVSSEKDLDAISSIISTAPIPHLMRIIDNIIKLQKENDPQPQLLAYLFASEATA